MRPLQAFSADEIERGRQLFAGEWSFRSAAGSRASISPLAGVEIAFAGRSNVGKSTLINALTGRRALARTSKRPGRTQELVFFTGLGGLVLVDLPGYGYAAAAKGKITAWTNLTHDYLRERASLARVYLLIDVRHGLTNSDTAVLNTLGSAAVSHEIVLTKCDLASDATVAGCSEALMVEMQKRPAAFPALIATSARTGVGIANLRAALAQLLCERC